MKITAILLFEANAKDLAVEFATCDRLTDDRTEASDEQNLDISDVFHDISCSHNRSNQIDLTPQANLPGPLQRLHAAIPEYGSG